MPGGDGLNTLSRGRLGTFTVQPVRTRGMRSAMECAWSCIRRVASRFTSSLKRGNTTWKVHHLKFATDGAVALAFGARCVYLKELMVCCVSPYQLFFLIALLE